MTGPTPEVHATRLTTALFDEGAPSAPPDRFNMADYCLQPGRRTPEKTALLVASGRGADREVWSFAAIDAAVRRAAAGLVARGLQPGERVMLRLGNTPRFPLLFFATIAAGGVAVPTSSQLSSREAQFIIEDAEPRFVCADPGLEIATDQASMLADAALAEILAHPTQAAVAETRPEDPAFLVYTSGATGRPKGVLHAQRSAWARRMMWRDWYGLTEDDRILHAGAFNWTYTLGAGLMDPWAAGASSVIYNGPKDPGVWPDLARETGATLFAAVPSVFRQTLKYGGARLREDFATLRHGLTAGEKLLEPVREAWRDATGLELYEALGMSECSTFISSSPSAPPRAGCVGRPQQGRRIAILPVEGGEDPLPIGQEGVLAVHERDPGLMLGYWRRPEEHAAMRRGPWFATGDLASMDADGYVTFLGRADDLMNAMGYRVAPQEVEDALGAHPAVVECAATAIRVREDVSVIAAFVVLREAVDADALIAHCADRLAPYKTPREIIVLDALPRTPNGKVKRRALADAHARV